MASIERQTHTIDAEGKSLGRMATEIAVLLRGKQRPTYMHHKDEGDFVIVKNLDKVRITGKKLEDKIYYRHSTYLGHLKKTPMKKIPLEKVLRMAVMGMLPKNRLRAEQIKRLTVE